LSTGSWTDTYAPRARSYTGVHEGGPADGTTAALPARDLPQVRYYASPEARRGRSVILARYVLTGMYVKDEISYQYAGTYERRGPVPGDKASPAWSQ
jgi:hypothetical protein